MFRTAIAAVVLLAGSSVAVAQQRPAANAPASTAGAQTDTVDKQAETGQPPKRVRSVSLTNGEKCPPSTSDEVVVCTSVEDPYRIPKALRGSGPIPAPRQAWTNRVAADEQTGRVAAGLPDTCSPVGSGGQSGCSMSAARAWAAEMRAKSNGQDPNQQ